MSRPGLWLANGAPTDAAKMLSWRPGAVCCFYDYLSANRVAQYKAANPNVPVIIRFQHPQNWHVDTASSAQTVANGLIAKWPEIQALDPFVYFWNELNLHYENGDLKVGNQPLYETPGWYEKVAWWTLEVADRVKQRVPQMRLVGPPYAFGHHEDGAPDDDGNPKEGWAGYDWLAPTIKSHFDNVLCGHYYWGDASGSIPARLYDPEISSWYAYRWRRVLNLFRARYGMNARMIIDEAGSFGAGDADFTAQCVTYAQETLMDPAVIALCFFLWEDPTNSPGNLPNSWAQRCRDLDSHIAQMAAVDVTPGVVIRVYSGGTVVTLPLEEYLRGVVPAEVYPSWPAEALKAQAVAARTYAMWRIAHPRHASYDIYATGNDQVWNPALIHARTDVAVRETAGEVLTYDGEVIAAYYSANCGGTTVGNETGFGGTPLPYCRPVGCANKGTKNGHGVGLCQWGAHDMAEAGSDYVAILKHYYTGVRLSSETEPPGNGGQDPPGGDMKIYDVLGTEKDAAWLASEWGVVVDTSLRRAGSDNFECIELREIEGPAVYAARVQDRAGVGWSGRIVGRYYPSAPNSWPGGSKPDNVPAPPEAVAHVVFGQTNSAGVCEFGIGGGDYAGPGDGVSALWLAEHYAGTDCVKKLGMKPGTNHRTISPLFRYVPAGTVDPVEPTPGGCNKLAVALKAFLDAFNKA